MVMLHRPEFNVSYPFPQEGVESAFNPETEAARQRMLQIVELPADIRSHLHAEVETVLHDIDKDPALGPQDRYDAKLIAEAGLWKMDIRPSEAIPAAITVSTMAGDEQDYRGSLRHELSYSARDKFMHGPLSEISTAGKFLNSRRGLIANEVRGLIEASPGYQLVTSFLSDQSNEKQRPAMWRYAQVNQDTQTRFRVNMNQLAQSPVAELYHRKQTAQIEHHQDEAPRAHTSRETPTDRAKAFFTMELSRFYEETHGSPAPEEMFRVESYRTPPELLETARLYAAHVNGKDAPPGVNEATAFLIHGYFLGFDDTLGGIESDVHYATEWATDTILDASFLRWGISNESAWLRGLDVASVATDWCMSHENLGQPPLTRERAERARQRIQGAAPIYRLQDSDRQSSRQRIIIETRIDHDTIPLPSADENPDLQLILKPYHIFDKTISPSVPYVADHEVISAEPHSDGGYTYNLAYNTEQESLYAFCSEPISDNQREMLIQHFASLGATRMVKYLGAYPQLRIGDISDLLTRSSKAWYPEEGATSQWRIDAEGFLNIQCLSIVRILRDSLLEIGIPLKSLHVISGMTLPMEGTAIDEAGHADLEYTSKSGQKYLLSPQSVNRDLAPPNTGIVSRLKNASLSLGKLISRRSSTTVHATTAVGRASISGILVNPADFPMLNPKQETAADPPAESETQPQPEQKLETEAEPQRQLPSTQEMAAASLASALETFDMRMGAAFQLGTRTRPATTTQVWGHMQRHYHPSDIVGQTAALFDTARDLLQGDLLVPAIKEQLVRIDDTYNALLETVQQNRLQTRRTYNSDVLTALMLSTNNLRASYQSALASIA
ncbi:MAG TPA: hypothetical protein VLI54_03980 [Bacillota bacterium]|nr:hypothetical protein [Bacillota bacterium]